MSRIQPATNNSRKEEKLAVASDIARTYCTREASLYLPISLALWMHVVVAVAVAVIVVASVESFHGVLASRSVRVPSGPMAF